MGKKKKMEVKYVVVWLSMVWIWLWVWFWMEKRLRKRMGKRLGKGSLPLGLV